MSLAYAWSQLNPRNHRQIDSEISFLYFLYFRIFVFCPRWSRLKKNHPRGRGRWIGFRRNRPERPRAPALPLPSSVRISIVRGRAPFEAGALSHPQPIGRLQARALYLSHGPTLEVYAAASVRDAHGLSKPRHGPAWAPGDPV